MLQKSVCHVIVFNRVLGMTKGNLSLDTTVLNEKTDKDTEHRPQWTTDKGTLLWKDKKRKKKTLKR